MSADTHAHTKKKAETHGLLAPHVSELFDAGVVHGLAHLLVAEFHAASAKLISADSCGKWNNAASELWWCLSILNKDCTLYHIVNTFMCTFVFLCSWHAHTAIAREIQAYNMVVRDYVDEVLTSIKAIFRGDMCLDDFVSTHRDVLSVVGEPPLKKRKVVQGVTISLVRYTERFLLHLRRLALLGVACRVVGARARAPTPALALHLFLLVMAMAEMALLEAVVFSPPPGGTLNPPQRGVRSAGNNGAIGRPFTQTGTRVRALRSCFPEKLNSCTVNLVCTSKCTSKFSVVIFPLFWGPGVGLAPLPL